MLYECWNFEVKDDTLSFLMLFAWTFIDLGVRSFMAAVTFLVPLYIFLSDSALQYFVFSMLPFFFLFK